METNENHPSGNTGQSAPAAADHSKDQLIKSIEDLCQNFRIGEIAKILNELLYAATHPSDSEEFTQEDAGILSDMIGILACLAQVYDAYHDYENTLTV